MLSGYLCGAKVPGATSHTRSRVLTPPGYTLLSLISRVIFFFLFSWNTGKDAPLDLPVAAAPPPFLPS